MSLDPERSGQGNSQHSGQRSGQAGVPVGDLLISLGVLGLGGYFVYGALQINVAQTYARVGPRFFPFLVAFGLLACGALLLLQALRGQSAPPEAGEDVDVSAPVDYRAVGTISAALVLYVLLLESTGFILASAVLFWGVALAFGSRAWVRDPLVGLALAFVVYEAFTRLLGLRLPAGLLAPLGL